MTFAELDLKTDLGLLTYRQFATTIMVNKLATALGFCIQHNITSVVWITNRTEFWVTVDKARTQDTVLIGPFHNNPDMVELLQEEGLL